jgi:hypothetical protein
MASGCDRSSADTADEHNVCRSRLPLQPPRRFLAGVDAISTAEQKIADLQTDI